MNPQKTGKVRCPRCDDFVHFARPGSLLMARHGPTSRPCVGGGKTLSQASDLDAELFKSDPSSDVYPDCISGAHGAAYDPPRDYDPFSPVTGHPKEWMLKPVGPFGPIPAGA